MVALLPWLFFMRSTYDEELILRW